MGAPWPKSEETSVFPQVMSIIHGQPGIDGVPAYVLAYPLCSQRQRQTGQVFQR